MDTQREAETQAEGEAGHAGSLMGDWIPGLQGHALGWRQALNLWAAQGSLCPVSFWKNNFETVLYIFLPILMLASKNCYVVNAEEGFNYHLYL